MYIDLQQSLLLLLLLFLLLLLCLLLLLLLLLLFLLLLKVHLKWNFTLNHSLFAELIFCDYSLGVNLSAS